MDITNPTIEEMRFTEERQRFDRKSARVDALSFAAAVNALIDADGGLIAVGIEDNGEITGIDAFTANVNELLRAPFDFCRPFVQVRTEIVDCTAGDGHPDHILLIRIPQSGKLHANQKDEVCFRVGDKSKKLNFDERLRLMYSKGEIFHEDAPVHRSGINDIDMDAVAAYCGKIGYAKSPEEYVRENKDYVVKVDGREEMSVAAILLFGKAPQRFFKRARVRFIRYEGTEERVGAEMNVIKDRIFAGRILDIVTQSIEFVRGQVKEHTFLGPDCLFRTVPEYPEFVWKELIVNAVAHRDYSIVGTDIQIKMFDDRITVESPGTLPGFVRLDNMRRVHFARNPKIAEFLREYEFVREFGEGVDRMYREMETAGLPEPEFREVDFMFAATARNASSIAR